MGNKQCSCLSASSPSEVKRSKRKNNISANSHGKGYNTLTVDANNTSASKLQHISDREQIDGNGFVLE